MNSVRLATLLLLASSVGACGGVGVTGPRPDARGVPGFDLRIHPGDAALETWRRDSPYRWLGYYLPAPCYTGTSWVGKRSGLQRAGWGLAVLFVGEQDWAAGLGSPPVETRELGAQCTRDNVTSANGTLDGVAAAAAAASEGFPAGTVVFLDVERVDSVSPRLGEYVEAWATALLDDGRYLPGLYAHRANAPGLWSRVRRTYFVAGRTDRPPLWITGGGGFDLTRGPADSGVEGATVWQGALDVRESWGGVELVIDRNVASSPSPSGR